MANTRAFKNLSSLRDQFDEPIAEEQLKQEAKPSAVSELGKVALDAQAQQAAPLQPQTSPLTGKVDGRRLRKVLKTPSVSLSVSVRSEIYDDVRPMLFARKTTWIAVLDELLTEYVAKAKAKNEYPK